MILIVGATGNLGGHVARQLLARGQQVRAMTRDPRRAAGLEAAGAHVVPGDLRDTASLRRATTGVQAVVSASHAILGAGKGSSARVDAEGQRSLIAAAKDAGVSHFVFTSALGASSSHPVDFWRTKAGIEQELQQSGLPFTIVRPSAFMEVHAYDLIGKAVMTGKPTVLFGPGNNPRNFVAAADVARLVGIALDDPRLIGQTVEIGGPENLTTRQVVATFERVSGKRARIIHFPLQAVRILARAMQPMHEGVSRILKATVVGETTDQTFDPTTLVARFPLALTPLEDWARAYTRGT